MKILSLRLKNLNSLKGEWKIDFTQSHLPATACLLLPARPVRGKPPCLTLSASRSITKHRASIRSPSRKTIS